MSTTTREDQQHTSKFAAIVQNVASTAATPPPPRRRRRLPRWLTLTLLAVVAGGLAFFTLGSSVLSTTAVTGSILTERARRTDLIVSITEDGTLESAHNLDIKCEVQGGSTILWIIPDGTEAHKGDELVRLDSAGIQEKIDLQRITYEKAKALKIEAEKTYESAKIAVQEYIEGMFVQNLQALQVTATVAKENLESTATACSSRIGCTARATSPRCSAMLRHSPCSGRSSIWKSPIRRSRSSKNSRSPRPLSG